MSEWSVVAAGFVALSGGSMTGRQVSSRSVLGAAAHSQMTRSLLIYFLWESLSLSMHLTPLNLLSYWPVSGSMARFWHFVFFEPHVGLHLFSMHEWNVCRSIFGSQCGVLLGSCASHGRSQSMYWCRPLISPVYWHAWVLVFNLRFCGMHAMSFSMPSSPVS